ncbi:uncharacterized protein LOC125663801 isoform X2 [Ostrea edulis]|uniref:uncharacterized protein LOC125663801 isoform X2 n=1 Tax=Ostrea edulis TaxID=37623 RepID=UPI0024AF7D99|nr:uncharacterized protein LOC125663801 isoform X2 [Ostrea edulis]
MSGPFIVVTLVIIFWTTIIARVECLYCLSCTESVSPRHCHRIQKCDAGETCFTRKYTTINGVTVYDTGCTHQSICSANVSAVPAGDPLSIVTDNSECYECCDGDSCNSHGCGSQEYPASRGPLCFTCEEVTDPTLCHRVVVCAPDQVSSIILISENLAGSIHDATIIATYAIFFSFLQVCHIQENIEFGDIFYTTSCINKHACHIGSGSIFGKRALKNTCSHCCSTDLCNINCGDSPSITTPASATGNLPFDCWDIYQSGRNRSGVYTIYPWREVSRPVDVFCNMEIPPGGWTVLQKRFDGSTSFNRTWIEYRNGFGSAHSEYWLGNEIVHVLTKKNHSSLHIIINSTSGDTWFEDYHIFAVGDESNRYRLTLGGPANGTAGDMMMDTGLPQANLGGKIFYTPDPPYNDNVNCTARLHGGWWFAACDFAFLNGLYGNVSWWNPWHGPIMQGDTFLASEMSFNRRHE